MSIKLCWGLTHYHIVSGGEEFTCTRQNATHTTLSFEDEGEAGVFLKRFLSDTTGMALLRRLVSDLGPPGSGTLKDAEVLSRLARLLVAKRALIIKCEREETGGGREQAAPPAPVKRKEAPPPVAKHWIEFTVIEQKTQRHVPEMTLKVTLPGRGEEQHTTVSADLHIDLASTGTADLLEMTHLDVWEVVDLKSG